MRWALTLLVLVLGAAMLGYGLYAVLQTTDDPVSSIPGSATYMLRDQAVVVIMGGGLLLLGALRLATKRPSDE